MGCIAALLRSQSAHSLHSHHYDNTATYYSMGLWRPAIIKAKCRQQMHGHSEFVPLTSQVVSSYEQM